MAWVTRVSMINGVKNGDKMYWDRFYQMYRPLVWLRGKDYGLTDSEQEDLLSDVMRAFFDAQKTFVYDPSKGRFRDYFRMIIRNQIFQILSKRRKANAQVELSEAAEVPDPQGGAAFEEDWQAIMFQRALDELKQNGDQRQVEAFILCKVQEHRPADVARLLGVSMATVYNDCNAVLRQIKELVKKYDAE